MSHNLAATATVFVLWAGAGCAAPITPTFSLFGSLPQATFGGGGIPSDRVAITTFQSDAGDNFTLGLAATPRFSSPGVTDDGAGTYFAQAGGSVDGPNDIFGALWNFSFFAATDGAGGGTLADLGLRILYDFDPGQDTDASELGVLSGPPPRTNLVQGSENLAFSFLNDDTFAPFVVPPLFPDFDPSALGQYTIAFESTVFDQRASINVQTIAPVPIPATWFLSLAALVGLFSFRRKNVV